MLSAPVLFLFLVNFAQSFGFGFGVRFSCCAAARPVVAASGDQLVRFVVEQGVQLREL